MKMKRQMRSWRHQPLFCCFLQSIAFRMFKRDRNGLRTAPRTVLVVNEAFNVHSQREPPVRYISGGYREGRDIAPQEWSVVTFTEFLAKFVGYKAIIKHDERASCSSFSVRSRGNLSAITVILIKIRSFTF
jgi:hypothetical protein